MLAKEIPLWVPCERKYDGDNVGTASLIVIVYQVDKMQM